MKRFKSKPEPRLDLTRFIPYLVSVLANRLSNELAQIYSTEFGISIPEWRVIAHLSQHKNVSVREINQRVDMDKAKVSRAAMRLEALGIVEKKFNERDRRLISLQLTKKGRDLFSEIEPLALDYESRFLATLPPRERKNFQTTVDTLLASPRQTANTARKR
jgi:DNA-binding MarR family transcriptional regulator